MVERSKSTLPIPALVEEAEAEATAVEAAAAVTIPEADMEVVATLVDTRKAVTGEAVVTKVEATVEATSKEAKRVVASRATAVVIKEDINKVAIRVGKVATRYCDRLSSRPTFLSF